MGRPCIELVTLVDYSIRDGKNIPPHLTCSIPCGLFMSQRGHKVKIDRNFRRTDVNAVSRL